MQKKYSYSERDVLVCNFATDERTIELSDYCFKKLGFENVITLKSNSGFVDKLIEFANIAMETDYEIFLRSDSDRLVFGGVKDLIQKFLDDKVDCAEGHGHEYFMNKFRGATPHIFSRKILKLLKDDNNLMPKVQKPENHFVSRTTTQGLATEKTYNILTNLHEYEQLPSKVCNSLLNRISRGHFHMSYYDPNYLMSLEKYKKAVEHALAVAQSSKKTSMDHLNFDFLDSDFQEIRQDEIESFYQKTMKIFQEKEYYFNSERGLEK